jgi:hypothetical protein
MHEQKQMPIAKRLRSSARPNASEVMQINACNLVRQCPCCNQLIQPKVRDYLPRPGTYRQYRCEHCFAWLTIDLRSRIKLIVLASIGIFSTGTGTALLLVATKAPIYGHERLAILPFALVFGISGEYALARYMQKIAKWIPVDD